jgi:chitin synthase
MLSSAYALTALDQGQKMAGLFTATCLPAGFLISCSGLAVSTHLKPSLKERSLVSGIRTPDQQRAWREKMGLISIIFMEMAAVGFITFGFTEAVCGTPPSRFHQGQIQNNSVIIHGYDYDFSNFKHPAVAQFNGSTNPLLTGGWDLASNDASFLFQITNDNCLGVMTKASGSSISGSGEMMDWYFPCNVFNPQSSAQNLSGYGDSTNCHVNSSARQGLASMRPQGQVYYTWDDVASPDRNLAVFES